MTHSPHHQASRRPAPHSTSSSSPSPPSSQLSPIHTGAGAPHPDFLGTGIHQDSPYLNNDNALDLNLNYEPFTFNVVDDYGHSSQLNNSTIDQSLDSLAFSNTTTLTELGLSPSSSTLDLHDSYWPRPYYSSHVAVRAGLGIHIETDLQAPVNHSYDPHSPYSFSPTGHSPSSFIPYPSGSPSSVGSAPPTTPEGLFISPNASPFINQGSISPVSPHINGNSPSFDGEESLDVQAKRDSSVLQIAERVGHPLGGFLVPQKTYRPHTLSDRRRYVEEVSLDEPIMFYTHSPVGCGILLRDAIASKFSALEGRDDSMFAGRGPSVSIRLNWPGYAPWSRQIPTRDFRSPPQPITRAKLARNVAKTVLRFIQEMENQQQEDPLEARWRVGSRAIRLEDLALVGLQHVSMGSWQAHVRFIPRRH